MISFWSLHRLNSKIEAKELKNNDVNLDLFLQKYDAQRMKYCCNGIQFRCQINSELMLGRISFDDIR